jgi:hypothetical protein
MVPDWFIDGGVSGEAHRPGCGIAELFVCLPRESGERRQSGLRRNLTWKRPAVCVILKVLAAVDISFPDSG